MARQDPMKPEIAEALLLRATPYGETDAVVHLLTREAGLLPVLARGARKSRRRFGGALDYFCLLSAEVRPGRHGLGTLLGVDLVKSFDTVRSSVDSYLLGCHVLEVARLGSREACPAPELFELVLASLEALERGAPAAGFAPVFQARALSVLGYGLALDCCPSCASELRPDGAALCAEPGTLAAGVTCAAGGGRAGRALSPGAFQTLRAALRLPLGRLSTLRLTAAVEAELLSPLEALLSSALGARPKSLDALHRGWELGGAVMIEEEKEREYPCF
ncbi:MAG: DNA repair protein RecO [Deltaproteobacteria bacterium]|nr:DNA repair protein RecO [Deltaproteobacteria bacterium]